jgi:hypothetical protein
MSLALAILMLAGRAPPPEPPPGLLFGYYRMVVFQQRARELHCGAGDLDRALEDIRSRLNKRFGKKAFSPPRHPSAGPGDCGVILSVYRVNLADFRRQAEAALNAPAAPATAPGS